MSMIAKSVWNTLHLGSSVFSTPSSNQTHLPVFVPSKRMQVMFIWGYSNLDVNVWFSSGKILFGLAITRPWHSLAFTSTLIGHFSAYCFQTLRLPGSVNIFSLQRTFVADVNTFWQVLSKWIFRWLISPGVKPASDIDGWMDHAGGPYNGTSSSIW